MVPRIRTRLTGRNLPEIIQGDLPAPSILNPGTIEGLTRVVQQLRLKQTARADPAVDALARFFRLSEEEQLTQFSRLAGALGQSPRLPNRGDSKP